jgi:hypothetical protein
MEAVVKNDPRAIALPFVFTPKPVVGISSDVLYKKLLEGNDPETGGPVIDEIIDVLTKPQEKQKPEAKTASEPSSPRETLNPDTEDNLQQTFYERGWTDGLPIILPTEELNLEFGVMPPLNSRATIILDPLVAANLKDNEGFHTKQDYCRHLSENIKIPAGQYWKTDYIDMLISSQANAGVEPYASWKLLPDDA